MARGNSRMRECCGPDRPSSPVLPRATRADSDAIFAFMQSVAPVKQPNKPHDLKFPYNNRSLIIGWRTLFFTEGEYKPDSTKSDQWNRGAYLVQGLGHCAMCHTAINALGGSR